MSEQKTVFLLGAIFSTLAQLAWHWGIYGLALQASLITFLYGAVLAGGTDRD